MFYKDFNIKKIGISNLHNKIKDIKMLLFFIKYGFIAEEQETIENLLFVYAKDQDVRVKTLLAEHLCKETKINKFLLILLANDPNIEVATPVIKHYLAFNNKDLISIISSNNREKTILIAKREDLDKVIIDRLINILNNQVLITLLNNNSINISKSQYTKILKIHTNYSDYINVALKRKDFVIQHITNIINKLPFIANKKLKSVLKELNITISDRVFCSIKFDIYNNSHSLNSYDIRNNIDIMHSNNQLTLQKINKFLNLNNYFAFIYSISLYSEMPFAKVAEIICNKSYKLETINLLISIGFQQKQAVKLYHHDIHRLNQIREFSSND